MTTTVLIPPTSITGTVSGGVAGSGNYYDFTVTSDNIYTFTTTPNFTPGVSKGNADLNLYQIIDGVPVFKAASDGITGEADVINVALTPGDYRLETLPFIGTVDYTLTATYHPQVNQDSSDFGINNSYFLGALDWGSTIETTALPDHQLVSNGRTVIDFNEHKGDMNDAYSFTIDKPTTVTVTLTPDANSNVDLALYDSQGSQIKGSFNDTGAADTVSADLKPGTYWVDAGFVGSSNLQSTPDSSNFVATYDLSMSAKQYVLPTTQFRAFNGNATGLAETFNFNNSTQPETLTVSNAVYAGQIDQSAIVNNFAGEVNAGILLTTGSAKSILGHTYNQKQGTSSSFTDTVNGAVNNWSNTGGNSQSMQPLTAAGNTAGYNDNVFKAVNGLVTDQNKVLNAENQLDPITAVYDAASLSFDVSVTGKGNFLSFDLLFGSEEYSLFADQYVDGAVIIVDGKNYALFDKTNPQSILSVTQSNIDKGYFYDNTQLADGTSVYPTEYNGISRLISVLAPIDTSLTTHHISIAIADTNDHVLDSGIFLTNLDSVDLTRITDQNPTIGPRETAISGLFANEAGTAANDVLFGSDGRDYSQLGAGNDKVDTGAGDDVISGGQGRDTIQAGAGNDIIQGAEASDKVGDNLNAGAGNDVVAGGGGVDTITGGTGSDSVDGGAGNDKITGGTDSVGDNLDGGVGNDTIIDGGGNDTVAGGAGNDSISSGGGADIIAGDTGRDSINAGAGNDEIIGGTDTLGDNLNGGTGNDDIAAGGGADTITGGTGVDTIDGGAGNDRITGGTDALGDNLDGGAGNDTVTAGAGNDTVDAGAGNDIVTAGAGDDTLSGGAGSDTVSGGAGQDDFIINSDVDVDTFADFSVTDDTISLDSSIFTSVNTEETITEDNLVTDGAATDANDYLIYDSSTGSLSYDADGNGPGEAVEVAVIGADLGLTSADFLVI